MPDFSSDDDIDGWEVRTTFIEDKNDMRQFAEQVVRSLAPKQLKQTLKTEFVDELKQK